MDKLVVQLVERFCNDSRFIAYGGIGAEMVCQVAPRLEQVFYTAMQQAGAERFGEVGVGTYLVAFLFVAQQSLAVSSIMGMWLVRTSFFSSRHISFPSITGIIMSLTMMSGISFRALSLPSFPFGGSLYFKVVGEGFGYIVADVRIVFHYQQYGFVAG